MTVRATEHIGPYHEHGSETIVDLIEPGSEWSGYGCWRSGVPTPS